MILLGIQANLSAELPLQYVYNINILCLTCLLKHAIFFYTNFFTSKRHQYPEIQITILEQLLKYKLYFRIIKTQNR